MPRRRPGALRAAHPRPSAELAEDLAVYRSLLGGSGPLEAPLVPGCPGCDPAAARDGVELRLAELPRHARAAAERVLAPLDAEFERRTLPDPFADPDLPWWWRRLSDR